MPPYMSVKVRQTTTPGTTCPTLYEECVGSLTSYRFITCARACETGPTGLRERAASKEIPIPGLFRGFPGGRVTRKIEACITHVLLSELPTGPAFRTKVENITLPKGSERLVLVIILLVAVKLSCMFVVWNIKKMFKKKNESNDVEEAPTEMLWEQGK